MKDDQYEGLDLPEMQGWKKDESGKYVIDWEDVVKLAAKQNVAVVGKMAKFVVLAVIVENVRTWIHRRLMFQNDNRGMMMMMTVMMIMMVVMVTMMMMMKK
jgi:hypothetical protein